MPSLVPHLCLQLFRQACVGLLLAQQQQDHRVLPVLTSVCCLLHVPEPSVDETYQILLGLRERYEAHHKLRYTDEALDSAAKYSSQYISDRFLPDKVRCLSLAPIQSSHLAHTCQQHAFSCLLA